MKLDLRFTARPLEDLWCDTVVAFVFQGPDGNGTGVPAIDVKTSGTLSALGEKGFWTGVEGETLLVPSQDMIKADKILLRGLGAQDNYSLNFLGEEAKALGRALDRMTVNDIGIQVPVKEGAEQEYRSYIGTACTNLVDLFLSRHKDEDDFLLKMVVSVDDAFIAGLEPVVRQLKEHFKSRLDYSIVISEQ